MYRYYLIFLSAAVSLLLSGCQAAKIQQPSYIVEDKKQEESVKVAGVDETANEGEIEKKSVRELINSTASKVNENSSVDDIAIVLTEIDLIISMEEQIGESDGQEIAKIQKDLIGKLRSKIKADIAFLQKQAIEAENFKSGSEILRKADKLLARYPFSESDEVISEAETLTTSQSNMRQRLELIRKQRYNNWAAEQADLSLRSLRTAGGDGKFVGFVKSITKHDNDGRELALDKLKVIEPSYLEPAVMKLYDYVLNEIFEKYKSNEKASLAKKITDRSVLRKGLEEF